MPGYELDLDQYIRVVHHLGDPIIGRYDGVDYEFPDGADGSYKDVHKNVAHHILGYGATPDQKLAVLHRLGWLNRMDLRDALKMLDEVQYHDVPAFGPSIVPFKRAPDEEPSPRVATASDEGVSGTAPAPAGGGRSRDPLKEAKRG